MNILIPILAAVNIQHLLIGFLFVILILAIIWGCMWFIETYIHAIPDPVKLVLAIILLILIILWAFGALGGGGLNLP